jgi:hypothetical protein
VSWTPVPVSRWCRPLPHRRGDDIVVLTDEDATLPLPDNPGRFSQSQPRCWPVAMVAGRWRVRRRVGPMKLDLGLEAAFLYPMTGADTAAALGSGEMPVLVTRGFWPWPSRSPWPRSPVRWKRVRPRSAAGCSGQVLMSLLARAKRR